MPIISAGDNHSLVVDEQGQVWVFGQNDRGELGINPHRDRNLPSLIPGLSSIKSVTTGYYHSLALNEAGQVFAFGVNADGQLGLSLRQIQLQDINIIPNLPPIKEITAGRFYSLILDMEGQVWSFGNNDYGQLGLGDTVSRTIPNLIRNLPPVKAIAASEKHSLVLTVDGEVWVFGKNTHGQLGITSGSANRTTPIKIPRISRIKAIAAGYNYSLILDEDGQIWSFGLNNKGQLGLGDRIIYIDTPTLIPNLPPIKAISAGYRHNLALDETGQVWGWGSKSYGQLGPFNNSDRQLSPVLIRSLSPMVEVSAGLNHSLTVDSQGQVWAFGANGWGQAGLSNGFLTVINPTVIPNITAKIPGVSTEFQSSSFIKTSYPVIAQYFPQIIDYRISPNQINDGTNDIFMEFEDINGNIYLARVQFDYQNEQIYPPTQSELLFEVLSQLIQDNQLTEYRIRSDLYQDERGNQGFEFLDAKGQRYLTIVYFDQGEIYPPLS